MLQWVSAFKEVDVYLLVQSIVIGGKITCCFCCKLADPLVIFNSHQSFSQELET